MVPVGRYFGADHSIRGVVVTPVAAANGAAPPTRGSCGGESATASGPVIADVKSIVRRIPMCPVLALMPGIAIGTYSNAKSSTTFVQAGNGSAYVRENGPSMSGGSSPSGYTASACAGPAFAD